MEVQALTLQHNNFYPQIEPFQKDYLKVSKIHEIYFEQYGNPDGLPVVLLHGGPGAGSSPARIRYFDPEFYRVIMLDQRAAMRSKPFLELRENTTLDLIEDLEKLRNHLAIPQWIVFGGSWGSALALLYAQTYPSKVSILVLYGVTLLRKNMVENILFTVKKIFPECYELFQRSIPSTSENLLESLYNQVFDSNPEIAQAASKAFMLINLSCSQFYPDLNSISNMMQHPLLALSVTKLFCHYAKHNFFVEEDAILNRIEQIKHIPLHILQGRFDIICPPEDAYLLHKALPKSSLIFITDANHTDRDISLGKAIIQTFNAIRKKSLKDKHRTIESHET